ncbi:MAG: sensor histidine kinase [Janthinobacterium lividum]
MRAVGYLARQLGLVLLPAAPLLLRVAISWALPFSFLAPARAWLRRARATPAGPVPPPIPGWVHALLLAVVLSFDGLMYYGQTVAPAHPLAFNHVWVVRNVALDCCTAALFYGTWWWLVPRTLGSGRVGQFMAAALLVLAASSGLRLAVSTLAYWLLGATTHLRGHLPEVVGLLALLNGGILLFSTGLYVTLDYLRSQRQRQAYAHQQLLSELSMLKAQLNPHFLFNTLNNIYSLASRKSDRAPEAVLRLAESMRYLLYESAADTVPLAQELRHLQGFLELQRLRLPLAEAAAAIVLHAQVAPEVLAAPVAPLLLLPLAENAFKHGDLAARPAVGLELEATAAGLRFVVHNFVAATPAGPLPAGGLGLANLRRRLALLYPDRHTLTVQAGPAEYTVTLHLSWA